MKAIRNMPDYLVALTCSLVVSICALSCWFGVLAAVYSPTRGWAIIRDQALLGTVVHLIFFYPIFLAVLRRKKEPFQPPQTTTGSSAPDRV